MNAFQASSPVNTGVSDIKTRGSRAFIDMSSRLLYGKLNTLRDHLDSYLKFISRSKGKSSAVFPDCMLFTRKLLLFKMCTGYAVRC